MIFIGLPTVIFEIIKNLVFSPSLSKQKNSSPKSTNPYPAATQFSRELQDYEFCRSYQNSQGLYYQSPKEYNMELRKELSINFSCM